MAVAKLLNLLAISCLAIIASYGPAPVVAVSVTSHHARSNFHAVIARRQRSETSKRCKARPSTTAAAKPVATSAKPLPPKSTPKSSDNGNNKNGGGGASPKPQPPSTGGGNGSAKVGIAWPLGNDPAIRSFKTDRVDSYYTWSPWCADNANKAGMKCCPMLWGDKQIQDFTKLVKPGYANCVLGFNEPDQHDQSNMSPQHGADLWRKYIDPLKDQGYKTISPATTSSPNGKKWMTSFFNACQGCRIDAIAIHWYGKDPQQFIDYVQDFYNTFKKPIHVTEFACQSFTGAPQCTRDQIFDFMKTVTQWMDNTWYVEQYYAFGAMRDMYNVNVLNQLLGPNDRPTPLGQSYITGVFPPS